MLHVLCFVFRKINMLCRVFVSRSYIHTHTSSYTQTHTNTIIRYIYALHVLCFVFLNMLYLVIVSISAMTHAYVT